MTYALFSLVLATTAPSVAPPPVAPRLLELVRTHHAARPEVLLQLTAAERAALFVLARDTQASVYLRARAMAFVGAHKDAAAEALWAEARSWPERELRIQAALSQVMAAGSGEAGAARARELLQDAEARVREVGVNRLWQLGARAVLEAHLAREPDAVVRELVQRRLSALTR